MFKNCDDGSDDAVAAAAGDDNGDDVDINECNDASVCSFKCVNTPGSYYCLCPEGYKVKGAMCPGQSHHIANQWRKILKCLETALLGCALPSFLSWLQG